MSHCRKVRYRDQTAALLALAVIARQDKTRRPKTETRAYRCSWCNSWHLTSQRKRQEDRA